MFIGINLKGNDGYLIWSNIENKQLWGSSTTMLHLYFVYTYFIFHRTCAIGVANLMDRTLENPRWYLDYGMIENSAAFEIPEKHSGLNLFLKKSCKLSYETAYIVHPKSTRIHIRICRPWNCVEPANTGLFSEWYLSLTMYFKIFN